MMEITFFACRHCQAHMNAYIHGELSPKARIRISRHLDRCASCYAVYIRERELTRELEQRVPLIGLTSAPQLAHIWAAVQADIAPRPTPKRTDWGAPLRFGLVALMFMVALLLPLSMRGRDIALAMPLPPEPQAVVERHQATAVAFYVVRLDETVPPAVTPGAPILLMNTPE